LLTAVVSGGSRGIGRAIVESLAADGYLVHFLYRTRDDAAADVVARVADAGGQAIAHRCDVTDREAVERVLETLTAGPIYALVNNAATLRDGHLLLMDEERWGVVVETVLTAAYRLARGCLRAMLHAQAGRIVNIGSLSGSLGQTGQANYAAAKGGLAALSRSLAREVGRYGITVNTVVPGWIDTDLIAALPEARRSRAVASVPLGRLGTPNEVAAVVKFLLSPAAGYITGAAVRVDGGLGS
jgi:3-oxoacyl-[acyl-carrier protein] reductase